MTRAINALVERGNKKLIRARELLREASALAEEVKDWYTAGALDAVVDALGEQGIEVPGGRTER